MTASGHARRASRSDEDQSLLRYWRILRERVWVIVACTVLALVAAFVYVGVSPKTYTAQATLEVQAASSSDTTLAGLPVLHQTGDPTEDVLTGAGSVTTQPVAQAVVRALRLKMSPQAALGHVSATPIGQAGLVAVVATGSSPHQAQSLANEFVTQTIVQSTARMHAAIDSELPGLKSQLAATPAAQRFGSGSVGQQVQELESLRSTNDPTFVNLASATLPTAPSSPRTHLSLIAGLVAGLLIGVAAAFLLHTLDPRLRREEQIRDRLGLPVWARIPREARVRARPLLPGELSPMALEGYRTLRMMLAARGNSDKSRAILVTSSAPAEGKSTTSIGLASALAHGGARVILLELDLRRPTFAELFGLKRFVGIEAVLADRTSFAEALTPVEVDGSEILTLPAHPSAGDAPGLMSHTVVTALIDQAKRHADYVIIDSAPLTAIIDALPFAQAADEVIIVARLDSTRMNRLVELDELLGSNGVTDIGIALVGAAPRLATQYYYNLSSGQDAGLRLAASGRRPPEESERERGVARRSS